MLKQQNGAHTRYYEIECKPGEIKKKFFGVFGIGSSYKQFMYHSCSLFAFIMYFVDYICAHFRFCSYALQCEMKTPI